MTVRVYSVYILERRMYQSNGVESLSASVLLKLHAQLVNLSLLLRRDMARVAWQFALGDGWVIIIVVLWVKVEGGNVCHFEDGYNMW